MIFARRHHPGSVALRTAMWSPWSHTGTIDGEEVIEAVFGEGVVVTPLSKVIARSSEWAIVEFPSRSDICPARMQVGKPYDTMGVVGLGVHQDWTDEAAWFCSALSTWDQGERGLVLFRGDQRRITPQHLWMLNYPIIASA